MIGLLAIEIVFKEIESQSTKLYKIMWSEAGELM